MAQQTSPTLSRAPVSIRKMIQIISDPVIYTSIGAVTALVGFGTWYYYFNRRSTRVLDQHTVKQFKLIAKTAISHNTNIYRFELPHKDAVLGLPIGQHVTLVANINGKEVSRSYTPTTSDENKGYFELLIKTYPNGVITQYLANMKVGDKIGVRGPKGAFIYTPNMVREIGMVAGGTGITPMLQIIRAILRNANDKTKIKLIFGNVTKEDILLEKELEQLATKRSNQFQVYHVLNEAPNENWNQGVGFITKQVLQEQLPKPASDVKILVCGPPPLVKAVTNATTELGFEAPRTVSKLSDQVFKF
ncbi:hypothetical protein EDC94DRAFT_609701 [Helicostylum pulchrum]|uniref:NADH-cytochrome b5 reductase n=1 Tax=Helicostylum pulchrum TaxID=562976 RepID=A0ABP9Y566_9FUNG|nr:hypothetical protein EDC94DRAFT_609701 [Helicostylum pulchrum]